MNSIILRFSGLALIDDEFTQEWILRRSNHKNSLFKELFHCAFEDDNALVLFHLIADLSSLDIQWHANKSENTVEVR